MAEEPAPRLCGLCKKGVLIPSGCGCNNAECHNFVDKWKPATTGYERPKPVAISVETGKPTLASPKPDVPTTPAPVVQAPAIDPATGEPLKKKRGRPKGSTNKPKDEQNG